MHKRSSQPKQTNCTAFFKPKPNPIQSAESSYQHFLNTGKARLSVEAKEKTYLSSSLEFRKSSSSASSIPTPDFNKAAAKKIVTKMATKAIDGAIKGSGQYIAVKVKTFNVAQDFINRREQDVRDGKPLDQAFVCSILGTAAKTTTTSLAYTSLSSGTATLTAGTGGVALPISAALFVIASPAIEKLGHTLGDNAQKLCHKAFDLNRSSSDTTSSSSSNAVFTLRKF